MYGRYYCSPGSGVWRLLLVVKTTTLTAAPQRERESAVTKEDVEGVLKKNARGGESLVARIVL